MWTAEAFLEGARADADKRLREETSRSPRTWSTWRRHHAARDTAGGTALAVPDVPPAAPPRRGGGLEACVEEADALFDRLCKLRLLTFLKGGRLFGLVFLAGLLLIYPLKSFLGPQLEVEIAADADRPGQGGGGGAVGRGSAASRHWCAWSPESRSPTSTLPLVHLVAEAELARDEVLREAKVTHQASLDATRQRYEQEKAGADPSTCKRSRSRATTAPSPKPVSTTGSRPTARPPTGAVTPTPR
ncbi:MAG: hypothetical protein U0797_14905 [Gemmataceae bacterium]